MDGELEKTLRKLLRQSGYRVYSQLCHVSQSGMTRDIKLLVAGKDYYKKPAIFNITGMVADIMDKKIHNEGIRVGGCGMNMGFHLVYNLSMKLYCPKKYNHDKAYKLKHEWV